MIKGRRHDADDRHCLSIQLHRAANNIWIASKATRPKSVAKHYDVVGARLEFFRVENTTSRRRNTQQWKEVRSARQSEQSFSHLSLLYQIAADKVVGRHLLKDCVLFTLIEEVGI